MGRHKSTKTITQEYIKRMNAFGDEKLSGKKVNSYDECIEFFEEVIEYHMYTQKYEYFRDMLDGGESIVDNLYDSLIRIANTQQNDPIKKRILLLAMSKILRDNECYS